MVTRPLRKLLELLDALGEKPITSQMSHGTAKRLFTFVETVYKWLPLGEPLVTGFLADAMARAHWFDMSPAGRDFGYHIRVSMADAMAPTVADLKERVVQPFRGQ